MEERLTSKICRKLGKQRIRLVRKAIALMMACFVCFAIVSCLIKDGGYAREYDFQNLHKFQQGIASPHQGFLWKSSLKIKKGILLCNFVKREERDSNGDTYWYESPYSPIEIQKWQSAGYRPLFHYQEFYYVNPDKSSGWQQAVCVRVRPIFDKDEKITNMAFSRDGRVYVFDWNEKTRCYEYRKALKPKHRKLWLRGFEQVFGPNIKKFETI